jgi:hypothetical protein
MPFITQGKTNWKYILIVVVLALIVGGGAFWYAKTLKKPYQLVEIKKSEKVSFEQLSICNIDSDCILVSHKSCGGMIKISINKKYESLYNSTPKFQDSTGEICKTRGISYDEQKQIIEGQTPVESLCLNGKCRPKYVEETASWKTYRDEELKIEFKYPDNYRIDVTGGHSPLAHPELGIRISIMPKGITPDINNPYIDINLVNPAYFASLDDYISKKYENRISPIDELSIGNIVIKIYKLENADFFYTFLRNKSSIFDISSPSKDFLVKVLSTFRFLE